MELKIKKLINKIYSMINSDKVMEKIKWKKEMKLSSEVKSFNFKYSDQGSFP